ncbi:RNA polymerase I-specific transcription initiation factor RRN3 [Crassisporium funariophilum]|nr:RNA polymerase I-specific transcription initiation factor RRN3 [Crassisporium funariophilum]
MDPHSRRSQFNQRAPRAGPLNRHLESIPLQKAPAESASKMASSKKSSASATTTVLIRRPIATNSRIKQDDAFRRDMYLSFVSNALHQKSIGVSDTFDELVAQFNLSSSSSVSKRNPEQQQQQQIDTTQIRLWIRALSHVVSRLERIHSPLVDAIVNMPWTTLDTATVNSYTIFIGMLLSAKPEYLSSVLAKVAHGFTYQSGIQALDASMPESSTAPLTRRLIYDRLHYLLRHVLSLIPTLPSTLQPLLVRHFPHKRQNQVAQTTYIRNLLRLSDYCPELADKILATIVDRAIQIDVEIQIEIEEIDDEENIDDQDVFEIDAFDVVIGQEGDSLSDAESDSDGGDNFSDLSSDGGDMDDNDAHVDIPTNVRHIQEMVKKLDAILALIFEHFKRTHLATTSGSSSSSSLGRTLAPLELPPLPPLENGTPGLDTPLTAFFASFPTSIPTPNLTLPSPSPIPTPSPTSVQPISSPLDKSHLRTQFFALLSIFDRIILRTFKSRYTQFLIFWYTSLDPEFADIFQGMLVDRALLGGTGASSNQNHAALGSGSGSGADGSGGGERTVGNANANMNMHALTPELTRAAAASYIGSFVSRATFVDREGARRVVGVLCEYLRAHLEGVEHALRAGWLGRGEGGGAVLAPGQHAVFYAVAQAVFLIFCFRWRDLVDDDEADEDAAFGLELDGVVGMERKRVSGGGGGAKDKWMPELGVLKRVVVSVLNPLKVCSPNVVMQFSRIAHATDFMYCYTILETNKRTSPSSSLTSSSIVSPPRHRRSSTATPTTALHPGMLVQTEPVNAELNTFFPFDPYRLPKSGVFIQAVYREWSSVALDGDDDSDSDSEEEEEEEGEGEGEENGERGGGGDGEEARAGWLDIPVRGKKAGNGDDGGLGASLGAMSISPARMAMSVSVSMR